MAWLFLILYFFRFQSAIAAVHDTKSATYIKVGIFDASSSKNIPSPFSISANSIRARPTTLLLTHRNILSFFVFFFLRPKSYYRTIVTQEVNFEGRITRVLNDGQKVCTYISITYRVYHRDLHIAISAVKLIGVIQLCFFFY